MRALDSPQSRQSRHTPFAPRVRARRGMNFVNFRRLDTRADRVGIGQPVCKGDTACPGGVGFARGRAFDLPSAYVIIVSYRSYAALVTTCTLDGLTDGAP